MLDRDLIIIDLETTGTKPETLSILDLGAVRFSKAIGLCTDTFQTYIVPYKELWNKTTYEYHKITEETIKEKGRPIEIALREFEQWIRMDGTDTFKDVYIAMWSCGWDKACLWEAYKYCKMKYPFKYRGYDIASIVRFFLAGLTLLPKNQGLTETAKVFGYTFEGKGLVRHKALDDAIMSGILLDEVYSKLKALREFSFK